MTVHIALNGNDTSGEINRKKAHEIAKRIANAARTKALAAWNPSTNRSQEVFADCAYSVAYEIAFVKAIAKQKMKKILY